MKKEIFEVLGINSSSYDNYICEQVLEDSNVLSKNDFAAIIKGKILKTGYEVVSHTGETQSTCWIYKKGFTYLEDFIHHIELEDENETIFEAYLWVLNKQK